MATTYYIKVNIESTGTKYTAGGIPFSLAGHRFYIHKGTDWDMKLKKT